ncbi:MAG: sensor histidine kinase [Vulcanimicrobiaceae bacterium]
MPTTRARAASEDTPRSAAGRRLGRSATLTAEKRRHCEPSSTLRLVTACIAHEVNQPLSGIMANASTCLRMLNADPPNVEGARDTALRTLRDVTRAAEVISRLRALFAGSEPSAKCPARSASATESLDLNQLVIDAVALSQAELYASRVTVTFDMENDLPQLTGDRIQLQQVLLNLIRNASEAMSVVHDGARTLTIATRREGNDHVRVSVQDVGAGFDEHEVDNLFTPFYTTKVDGMGIGLCVSRTIVENHRGRLWGIPNTDRPGATFLLALPCGAKQASQHRQADVGGCAEPDAPALEGSL